MSKKANTRDVAKLAGVSQSAVSFILSGSNRFSFSDETRGKVLNAAQELGYQPPARKRRNGRRQASLVLVLVPTLANQYYSELGRTLENLANAAGVKVIVCGTSRKRDVEAYYLDFFVNAGIDGIIYGFLPSFPQKVGELNRSIPVVVIGEKQEELSVCSIGFSNLQSASLLGEHLYALGHRRFAFISTQLDRTTLARRQRFEGIRLVAKKHGLPDDAVQLISPPAECDESETDSVEPYEYTLGRQLAQNALANNNKATAFVGVNDMTAIGVMGALAEAGFRIPEDISVCGFDNIFTSSLTTPGITTIDHNLNVRCRTALNMILARSSNSGSETFVQANNIEYAPQLIVRGSTGPAKK